MSTNSQLDIVIEKITSIDAQLAAQNPTGGVAEADATIAAGQPIYVVSATGHVDLAQADALPAAGYAGLATTDTAATFAASYSLGLVSLADWTAAAGSQYLTPGALYYLDQVAPGRITTIAPTASYLVVVGRALSPSQLHAYQEPIILL
jgi:hypothetical protein